MRTPILLLFISCLSLVRVQSADIPVFQIEASDIQNIVVDATPQKPWIFSITLTEQKLTQYKNFTAANLHRKISLVVAGVEIYKPDIHSVVSVNPITFRMFDKKKFIAILSALPPDPE